MRGRQWWSRPQSVIAREPMPVAPPPAVSPIQGNRVALPRVTAAGLDSFALNTPVGLVRAEKLQWGPWSVTLDAMPLATVPWPAGGLNVTGRPRVQLGWGVGGNRRECEFDYPYGGGAFVVNADAVEVKVRATVAEPVASPAVPVTVGAWLTPGAAPGPVLSPILTLPDSATASSVPPFARYLVVSPYDPGAPLAAGTIRVRFTDSSTLVQWWFNTGYGAGGNGPFRVPVPPLATRVDISLDVGPSWSAFFELAFA